MAPDSGYRALLRAPSAGGGAVRAKSLVTPLSDLQHAAVEPLGGDVELLAAELLAIQADAAPRQQAASLRARDLEQVVHECPKVDYLAGRQLRLFDLVGQGALDVEPVEVSLGLRGRLVAVEPG